MAATRIPERGPGLTVRERFSLFTPMIVFITLCAVLCSIAWFQILTIFISYMALCAFNFGFDVGNFAGVRAMQRKGHHNDNIETERN